MSLKTQYSVAAQFQKLESAPFLVKKSSWFILYNLFFKNKN
ncbi:hypothetical protein BSPA14S_I0046 (plasmid) [Borreliella spielmanii A14S]|uniref:Uncharacterized protein n=1 Tax=Borreliella spielmanii A14S TaxID=498742 RepID=C0RCC5_9SPIR|nr:hypothetical protein BSPA14S_I0046 [Borreliella spielmanii A14S]